MTTLPISALALSRQISASRRVGVLMHGGEVEQVVVPLAMQVLHQQGRKLRAGEGAVGIAVLRAGTYTVVQPDFERHVERMPRLRDIAGAWTWQSTRPGSR